MNAYIRPATIATAIALALSPCATGCVLTSSETATNYDCASDGEVFTYKLPSDPAAIAKIHVINTFTCTNDSSITQDLSLMAHNGVVSMTCAFKSSLCHVVGQRFTVVED